MKKLKISKTIIPYGFGRPQYCELVGVRLGSEIAYLDTDETVKVIKEADLKNHTTLKIVGKES